MRSGQCLCGSVRMTAETVEAEIGACHCQMCQRWSGGIFLTATARGVKFEGMENISRYRSSKWAERGFCRKCGSLLFYRLLDTDEYEICVGIFDDQSDFALSGEIFIDRKPGAYALSGDHPRLTEAQTLEKYKVFGK